MPGGLEFNADGSLREFTQEEIDEMEIQTADVRDGTHPTQSRGPLSTAARRPFFFKWEFLERFVAYTLGGAVLWADEASATITKLSRLKPQTYPGHDQWAAVEIESITGARGAGVDDEDGVPAYPRGKAVVRYEHVFYTLKTDAETTVETERYVHTMPSTTDVSYLNLPGGVMTYLRQDGTAEDTPRPHLVQIPYSVGFPEPQSVLALKWWRVPRGAWGDPSALLYQRVYGDIEAGTKPYIGSLNKTPFLNRPAGHLMFLGVEEELVTDPVGGEGDALCWNLTLKWLAKSINHNYRYFWECDPTLLFPENGWYLAGRGNAWFATADTPDDRALFHVREHANLFVVGAV